ncbi:MAG: class I SAM-dependent rRNA methyltransferase [Bacteroidota bacterium]|nr:class I SAM-dependent rRNA methyltransferase [Bacteroidota bacterium]MDX5431446.1 class I SAM-dependent rRNA methyltransferase [Bacteroidota bacterium]MDX5470174.1 class I SAM-dependent rRNA methyltransferase [Bacteroidota bacterium]
MYPQLILKPKKERAFVHRHPWIFSGAVASAPKVENGEIVEVISNEGRLLGYGFYSPFSQIVCRVFEFDPKDKVIDQAYWKEKIKRALDIRKELIDFSRTDCYRLLHAEGDFFPGIIADAYGKSLVVQLLIKGTERLLEELKTAFMELGFEHIYLKTKQSSQILENINEEITWLTEPIDLPVVVQENGVKLKVDFEKGQKTGFFLDQRVNRQIAGNFAQGKKVLNTFCYTGGFSVYALQGGAEVVHSVDSSKDAIAMCDENVALNGFQDRHESFVADCFDFLKAAEPHYYDLVILDPPAFAKSARKVENATRGYKELNMLGIKRVKPGGLILTFSCSQNIDKMLFQKVVFGAAADVGRNVRILQHLGQPLDHPVNIYHPEGEYLKGLLLYVE